MCVLNFAVGEATPIRFANIPTLLCKVHPYSLRKYSDFALQSPPLFASQIFRLCFAKSTPIRFANIPTLLCKVHPYSLRKYSDFALQSPPLFASQISPLPSQELVIHPSVAPSNDKIFRHLRRATNATRVGLRSLFEKTTQKLLIRQRRAKKL